MASTFSQHGPTQKWLYSVRCTDIELEAVAEGNLQRCTLESRLSLCQENRTQHPFQGLTKVATTHVLI